MYNENVVFYFTPAADLKTVTLLRSLPSSTFWFDEFLFASSMQH